MTNDMTFAAARQSMRHFYDQWNAARTLHAVLEKAEQAESFLGQSQPLVKAAEDKLAGLETQYTTKVTLYETKLAEMEATLAERQSQVTQRISQMEQDFVARQRTQGLELQALEEELARARADHEATLKILGTEASSARARAAEARGELESAKARFSTLFG